MKPTKSEKSMEAFSEALKQGINKIYEACKIYVEAIDNDPTMKERFIERFYGEIPVSTWSTFEKVGRGHLHHKLLFGGGHNKEYFKRLAHSDQDMIMSGELLPLLTASGDTLMVDAREITTDQAKQLFNKGSIRPVDKQRAYIESVKTLSIIHTPFEDVTELPYIIRGNKIKIDGVYTKTQFKQICREFVG